MDPSRGGGISEIPFGDMVAMEGEEAIGGSHSQKCKAATNLDGQKPMVMKRPTKAANTADNDATVLEWQQWITIKKNNMKSTNS